MEPAGALSLLPNIEQNKFMKQVTKHITTDGRRIYGIPVRSFPRLVSIVHLISDGDKLILIDTGSGRGDSNSDLMAGLAHIGEHFGETVTLTDIDEIWITHGHMDHFGGLPFVRQHSEAPIGVHILDRRVISNFEERRIVAARRLDEFLEGAGLEEARRLKLMSLYLWSKDIYKSLPIQFLIEEGTPLHGGVMPYHTPGHCPGQVCLMIDDIMLTSDHVLSRITPHQAPESITRNMGLSHYLDALTKIQQVPGMRLGIGNHEDTMTDVYSRIDEIKVAHDERLNKVMAICKEPKTVAEVSNALFGPVENYHVLLALEEAGAHVEYLYQRGELLATNLTEIERTPHPVIRYVAS